MEVVDTKSGRLRNGVVKVVERRRRRLTMCVRPSWGKKTLFIISGGWGGSSGG